MLVKDKTKMLEIEWCSCCNIGGTLYAIDAAVPCK